MANLIYGMAQKLANTLRPSAQIGPAGLKYKFPFLTQNVTDYRDAIPMGSGTGIEMVVGAFIDNSNNAVQFTLYMEDSGQTILVPAYSQADFELIGLIGAPSVRIRGVTTGNVDVPVTFKNVPGQNTIWSVLAPGTIPGNVTVTGSVIALPTNSAPVDRSLTTGALNTPQILMPANAGRRYLNIMNPYANSGKPNNGLLTVGFGAGFVGGSPGGYDIAPGGSFTFDSSFLPTSQIWISASDANCAVSAMEA